jgi:restriction endonuclease S subunit
LLPISAGVIQLIGCKGILAKNIDYEFLYYLLNLSKIKLENLGSGNTFKEISTNNLKEMLIYLCNLD